MSIIPATETRRRNKNCLPTIALELISLPIVILYRVVVLNNEEHCMFQRSCTSYVPSNFVCLFPLTIHEIGLLSFAKHQNSDTIDQFDETSGFRLAASFPNMQKRANPSKNFRSNRNRHSLVHAAATSFDEITLRTVTPLRMAQNRFSQTEAIKNAYTILITYVCCRCCCCCWFGWLVGSVCCFVVGLW